MVIHSLPKMQQLKCFQGNCYRSKAQCFLFRVGWGWHGHETTCDGNHRLPSHHGLILWGCEVLRCVPLDLFNILTSRNILYVTLSSFKATISTPCRALRFVWHVIIEGAKHRRVPTRFDPSKALQQMHQTSKANPSKSTTPINTLWGCALNRCVLPCGFVVFNLKSKAQGSVTHPAYGKMLQVTRNQGLLLLQSLLTTFPPQANRWWLGSGSVMNTWIRSPSPDDEQGVFFHHLRNETHSLVFRFDYHSKFRWDRIPKAVVSFP